jgi:hypothetical protein
MTGSRRGPGKNLQARVAALERRLPPSPCRVTYVWDDGQGRLTKLYDSHPHLPDDYLTTGNRPSSDGTGGFRAHSETRNDE